MSKPLGFSFPRLRKIRTEPRWVRIFMWIYGYRWLSREISLKTDDLLLCRDYYHDGAVIKIDSNYYVITEVFEASIDKIHVKFIGCEDKWFILNSAQELTIIREGYIHKSDIKFIKA